MCGSFAPGAQGICPVGWHVPTDTEWNILENYTVSVYNDPATMQYPCNTTITGWRRCADDSGTDVGGPKGVGAALKKTTIGSGVGAGTERVGFSAILPGSRHPDGLFNYRTNGTSIWSSVESGSSALRFSIEKSYSTLGLGIMLKDNGYSVRCLKN